MTIRAIFLEFLGSSNKVRNLCLVSLPSMAFIYRERKVYRELDAGEGAGHYGLSRKVGYGSGLITKSAYS